LIAAEMSSFMPQFARNLLDLRGGLPWRSIMSILSPRVTQRGGRIEPTGPARIVGGAALLLTAFFTLSLMVPHLLFEARGVLLLPMALGGGAWIGWRTAADVSGEGRVAAALRGIRAALYLGVWILAYGGVQAMLFRAVYGRYRDPLMALTDVARLAVELAVPVARPDVIVTLFLGGVLSAILAEWTARRWR
jgi:hypothetical protein